MPKKMGMNSKAIEARERKKTLKTANQVKEFKESEDFLWQDKDKALMKKQKRLLEEEQKRIEAQKRKAEVKELLDKEMSSIKIQGKQPLAKINRQQVLDELEKKQQLFETNNASKKTSKCVILSESIIEPNLNRGMANVVVATNLDQAISALSLKNDVDQHPEKRMRSAYKAFEEINMQRIKTENPTLRLTQWKQILIKEWNKSPENPFNKM